MNPDQEPTRTALWSPSILRVAGGILLLMVLVLGLAAWVLPLDNIFLLLFFIFLIAGCIYYVIRQFTQLQGEILSMQDQISRSERESLSTTRRSQAIFQLSQKFVEANEENEVLNTLLTVTVDMVGALGASVVPLDERGQPLTAISHGEIPNSLMDSWVEYLASPEVRNMCGACQRTGSFVHNCPLVELPVFDQTGLPNPSGIFCLHLRRGERDLGILNLYLAQGESLDAETQEFLQTLLDETALVLENLQAQKRELVILQQMRHQTDIQDLQLEFLQNVQETLRADFVLLHLMGDKEGQPQDVFIGDNPDASSSLITGVIEGVQNSGKPLLLGDVESEPDTSQGLRSLICAPLVISDEPAFGVILAGRINMTKFTSRHLSLLQTLAGQLSLVVRNAQLRAEIEINSILAERTRLAREIHDGLAQTLGFLKLQSAQMENYLAAGDTNRLQTSLSTTYKVLTEAYLDVRQAIDDLRISPDSQGLVSWLQETCTEFEENTGLKVSLDGGQEADNLPPEIQVQLIRIIQEALSNVRKHSQASQAWIDYHQEQENFLVEIRDDGRGFHPHELPGVSQYGLQGMRERAEIIGADLLIISAPQEGTIIKVRVPVPAGEGIS